MREMYRDGGQWHRKHLRTQKRRWFLMSSMHSCKRGKSDRRRDREKGGEEYDSVLLHCLRFVPIHAIGRPLLLKQYHTSVNGALPKSHLSLFIRSQRGWKNWQDAKEVKEQCEAWMTDTHENPNQPSSQTPDLLAPIWSDPLQQLGTPHRLRVNFISANAKQEE